MAGTTTVGILALQGDFGEHAAVLERLFADIREVRLPRDLEGVSGIILPGGESTTFTLLMDRFALRGPLKALAATGAPLWGTCAGLIALAARVEGYAEPILDLMDIAVERNAYGRQIDSFEADIDTPVLGPRHFHAIFIRAPRIASTGPTVKVLARLNAGWPVAVQQRNLLGTSFHPELTNDDRFHQYFLDMVKEHDNSKRAAAR